MTAPGGGKVDTAYVEIVPETSHFSQDAKRGVESGFDGVEAAVRELVAEVERAFEGMTISLSNDFHDIGQSLERALGGIDEDVVATAHNIEAALDRASDEAREDARLMQARWDEAFTKMGVHAKETGAGIGGSLKGLAISGAVLGGVTAVGFGLEQLTSFGLKSAATMEQVQIQFQSLTGSVAKGQAQFQSLQKFAAATPFEFKDLTTTAARFDSFAASIGKTQDQLIPFITTLGNVVSVTGGGAENLDSVSLAFAQIASRGKLTLDNLNQLSNALPGFNGVAAIANATGKTQAQVMDDISSGAISAKDGINELLAGMQQFPGAAGAMEKQGQTLLGVFSTFQDTISQALTNAFQPVIPGIKDTLTQITPIIGDAVNTIAPNIGRVLTSLLSLAGPLIKDLSDILAPLLDQLAVGIEPIGEAIGALGGPLADLALALSPLLVLAGDLAASLVEAFVPIIRQITPVVDILVQSLEPVIFALEPIISMLGTTIAAILAPALQLVGEVIKLLAPYLAQFITALGTMLRPLLEALGPVVNQLVMAFMPLIPALMQLAPPMIQLVVALTPLIVLIAQLLTLAAAIITPFIQLTAVVVGFLASKAIVPLINLIVDALTAMLQPLNSVIGKVQEFSNWINNLNWHKIGDGIVNGLDAAWHAVVNFLSMIGNAVTGFFSSAGSWLYDAGKNIVMGLVHGLEGAWHFVTDKVKELTNVIPSGVRHLLGIGSPSKVMRGLGRDTGEGYALGVEDQADRVYQAINNIITPPVAGVSASSNGAPVTLSPGAVQIIVNGAATPQQAQQAGQAAAQGLVDRLSSLGFQLAAGPRLA